MAARISPTRSIGSSSREQWNGIASVQNVPESLFHPSFSPSPTNMDAINSARRVGSGSRSQWHMVDTEPDVIKRSQTQALKELDLALGDVSMASSSDGDNNMDTYIPSDATCDNSEATTRTEATARTGNTSSNSPKQVTPENSPGKEGRGRKSMSKEIALRDISPEPKRHVMCGAVSVKDEWKETIQDVNETVRQIFSVRRFGPDEKDAVRDVVKDASYFMKNKVRAALLRKATCADEEEVMDGNDDERPPPPSPTRRGRKKLNGKRSSADDVRNVRRRERGVQETSRPDKSEEAGCMCGETGCACGETECTVTRMLV